MRWFRKENRVKIVCNKRLTIVDEKVFFELEGWASALVLISKLVPFPVAKWRTKVFSVVFRFKLDSAVFSWER